jgi:hypothetical protein
MHPLRNFAFVVCLPAMFCTPVQAGDEDFIHPRWNESFHIRLGVYDFDADAKYSVTKTGEPRETINLDNLGIDGDTITPMFELGWQFKHRWSLLAAYFRFDEDGRRRNTHEFVIDGTVFPVSAALDSHVSIDTYLLNLGYSFIKDERKEFGIGLGVHGFDFETDVTASILIGDSQFVVVEDSEDVIAPLPNIRIFGRYAFNSRWYGSVYGGWLSADFDQYSGDLFTLDAWVEFRATTRLGLGLGYLWSSIDVTVDKTNKDEEYDVEFRGPLLYLSYNF